MQLSRVGGLFLCCVDSVGSLLPNSIMLGQSVPTVMTGFVVEISLGIPHCAVSSCVDRWPVRSQGISLLCCFMMCRPLARSRCPLVAVVARWCQLSLQSCCVGIRSCTKYWRLAVLFILQFVITVCIELILVIARK